MATTLVAPSQGPPSTPAPAEPTAPAAARTKGKLSRVRAILLLRLTSALATAYLLVAAVGFRSLSPRIIAVLALALASNALIAKVPASLLESRFFTAGLMLADTAWMTTVLVMSGQLGGEFFLVYFFILFLAGMSESVGLVAVGAVVVSAVYLMAASRTGGGLDLLHPGTLIRVPFFLAVAVFYSYLIEQVRTQRQVARAEASTAQGLREAQAQLVAHAHRIELVNAELEAEVAARRRAEVRLNAANVELSRLNAARSEFVAMVAHELKTPLACIKSATEMLVRCKADRMGEAQDRFLGVTERNVARLSRIVGDLLDLARIDAGLVECRLEPVNVGSLVADLLPCHRQEAARRQIQLELRAPDDLPEVLADAERIEQIVTNLISNAMKFTPPGGRIDVELVPEGEEVVIGVLDTGIGLSPEDQSRVFERFYQVREEGAPRQGTGLGLSIARQLARQHGGDIELHSRLGEGSRFSFRLRAATAGASRGAWPRPASVMDVSPMPDVGDETGAPTSAASSLTVG